MIKGISISSLSLVTVFIRSINKNCKLNNLFAKAEKIVTFLPLVFLNLE